jgi:hypothetical protein
MMSNNILSIRKATTSDTNEMVLSQNFQRVEGDK